MATLIVRTACIYVWIGLSVGVAFLVFGIERVDPAARSAYAFRPLLLPGLTLLWPYVLRRWSAKGFF